MVTWQTTPGGGARLDGLYGLDVVVSPAPGMGEWAASVTVIDTNWAFGKIRTTRRDAEDWALTRALRLYPAVVELARRRALEGDPDDMTECRRSEHDLLVFSLGWDGTTPPR